MGRRNSPGVGLQVSSLGLRAGEGSLGLIILVSHLWAFSPPPAEQDNCCPSVEWVLVLIWRKGGDGTMSSLTDGGWGVQNKVLLSPVEQ